ncbi:hypothetical protein BS47DRAFT_1484203 [Hydnum rufescens UP504]|uniref:3'-5' exonuclease domain-containing protein n=1 Tax=Hydnum rufescens UP504 TaxID=1448309 RepID=A0A9P6B1M9_9AGAM|nr:hypothetical protein BS47DRAFT_1484203 [Hydnum rufescens UP504]
MDLATNLKTADVAMKVAAGEGSLSTTLRLENIIMSHVTVTLSPRLVLRMAIIGKGLGSGAYARLVFQSCCTYITPVQAGNARNLIRLTLSAPSPRPYSTYSFLDLEPRPQVYYIRDVHEADNRVAKLELTGPLGFDMEWRVSYYREPPTRVRALEGRTALVQVCDRDTILLIQLSAMCKFPQKLEEVLQSPSIVKTGVAIAHDARKLLKDYAVKASNLVELSTLAIAADASYAALKPRKLTSLAKLVERYTGKVLDKDKLVQCSDWEKELTESQQAYAANDVRSGLSVYLHLLDMASATGCMMYPGANSAPSRSSGSTATMSLKARVDQAYQLWHNDGLEIDDICIRMRSKEHPLRRATVATYILTKLAHDKTLPYDPKRLRSLLSRVPVLTNALRDWGMPKNVRALLSDFTGVKATPKIKAEKTTSSDQIALDTEN